MVDWPAGESSWGRAVNHPASLTREHLTFSISSNLNVLPKSDHQSCPELFMLWAVRRWSFRKLQTKDIQLCLPGALVPAVLPWDWPAGEMCQAFCSWQAASDLELLGFDSVQQPFIEECYVVGTVLGSVRNPEVDLVRFLSLRILRMVLKNYSLL